MSGAEEAPHLPAHWSQLRLRFKNRILTGLIFIVPLLATLAVAWWLYQQCVALTNLWITGILENEALPRWTQPAVQFAGVIVTLFAIGLILWVIGTLSSSFLMRQLVKLVERIVLGVPVVRQVYTFSKQVVALIVKKQSSKLQRVVIIEYPKEGSYALAFATGETRMSGSEEVHVTLFVPTTPNPTSGFMLVIPQSQVREIQLPVEEAVRLIMSGGIIVPDEIALSPYKSTESSGG
jgi:uncharacterized membrane protein